MNERVLICPLNEKKKEEQPKIQRDEKSLGSRLTTLNSKYGIFRAAKFGAATGLGFLTTEVIIALGVYLLYRSASPPQSNYLSLPLIELNIIAFFVGVTVAFFVNERVTVQGTGGGIRQIVRLFKYQAAYVAGNAVTLGVELGLLAVFSTPPAIGNIIGALVAFPMSYFISMKFVWKVRTASPEERPQDDLGAPSSRP